MTTYRPEPAGLDKLSITAKTLVTAAVGDHVLIADLSDSSNLKKVTVQTIVDLATSIPTAITVANEAVDTSCSILFATAATGNLGPKTNAGLTFNSATGALSSKRGTTDGEFFGAGSGVSNTTGNYNTGFGDGTLAANTTGNYNTAIGWHTLFANTTGDYNVGIGLQALVANTTGIKNTALGMQTLNANTSGSYNVASGYQALVGNTTGSLNNAYGNDALHSNTTGDQNTAVGHATLNFNSTGSNNTGCGQASLYTQTTGSNNTALGLSAGHDITTGSFNVVIGANANPVSLSGNAQLNLGNLVFGTGLYSGSTPSSTAVSGGRIGIGKNNPATTLDVNGDITASGTVNTTSVRDGGAGDHYMSSITRDLAGNYFTLGANGLKFGSNAGLMWQSGISIFGAHQTSLSQNAAGVIQIGTTANNALGSLLLTNLTASGTATLGIYTVATLPSASSNPYAEANVSDALTPAMGSTVASGGAVKTKVRSNGTNWTVAGI